MIAEKITARFVLRMLRDTARMLLVVGLVGLVLAGCSGGSGDGAGGTPPAGGSSGDGSGAGTGQGGGSGSPSFTVRPVVYVADEDVYDRFELYMSSPTEPGASIKLNPPLPVGANVDCLRSRLPASRSSTSRIRRWTTFTSSSSCNSRNRARRSS